MFRPYEDPEFQAFKQRNWQPLSAIGCRRDLEVYEQAYFVSTHLLPIEQQVAHYQKIETTAKCILTKIKLYQELPKENQNLILESLSEISCSNSNSTEQI